MRDYQCTINCYVCLADGDNNDSTCPITREYHRENVRDVGKIFNFRGRKEIAQRQRASARQKGREKEKERKMFAIPL